VIHFNIIAALHQRWPPQLKIVVGISAILPEFRLLIQQYFDIMLVHFMANKIPYKLINLSIASCCLNHLLLRALCGLVLSSIRIGPEWMIIKMGYVFKHVVAVCNAIDVTL
jgi:hypothetical protein